MPQRPHRPCRHTRCPKLTTDGWCDEHRSEARQYDRYRGTAAKRGYDRRWREFRLKYLAQHPLCVDCEAKGHVHVAEHLHHIQKLAEHPELKYVDSNLMSLCETHHDARTAKGE